MLTSPSIFTLFSFPPSLTSIFPSVFRLNLKFSSPSLRKFSSAIRFLVKIARKKEKEGKRTRIRSIFKPIFIRLSRDIEDRSMCKIVGGREGYGAWDFPCYGYIPRGHISSRLSSDRNGSFRISISVIQARSCEKLKGLKWGNDR